MADTRSPSGVSFWRQDLNWYVQQQSWTRSFFRQDQDWNQRLSSSNSRNPVHPSAGPADIADQKIVNLVNAPAALPFIDAPPSSSSAASGAGSDSATGTTLNLLA
jgi:hypothetical protein